MRMTDGKERLVERQNAKRLDRRYQTGALIVGRDLHAPWNEGRRVITRNFAEHVVGPLRPAHCVSLTRLMDAVGATDDFGASHVYARRGIVGDYSSLPFIARYVHQAALAGRPIGVAHLFTGAEVLAPWLKYWGIQVVVHVVLTEHTYTSSKAVFRDTHGWHLFDRWVDSYALSSPALVAPLSRQGRPASKLRVIPPAIDTSVYRPRDRVAARLQLGLDPDQPLVVYIGTVSPMRFPVTQVLKGLQEAGAEMGNGLRLLVCAPVLTHDYNLEWSQDIQRQVRDSSDLEVEVLLKDLGDDEKATWFQAADVVLIPFAGPVAVEPPLTLVEAMACGASVMATPVANRSQIVESGYNGFVYESPSTLAAHVLNILSAPDGARSIQARARQTILQRYSFEAATEATIQLWSEIGAPEPTNSVTGDARLISQK